MDRNRRKIMRAAVLAAGILEHRGADASILFMPTLGRFGSLRHRLMWSHVLQARSNSTSLDGNFGFPKNRAQLSSIWRFRVLDAAWNINLIGKHGDDFFGHVGSHVTHDLQLGWVTPLKGVKLVVGAVNITEKMPVVFPGRAFDFNLYDGYGRQAYARLEVKF